MARKSNKTAHVLNLLAGHDAGKDTDEQTSPSQEDSAAAGQTASDQAVSQETQAVPADTAGQDKPASGVTPTRTAPESPAGQTVSPDAAPISGIISQPAANPAPVPSIQSQSNNIAVIDKTGDDPVAELIQQKLTSEFEKHIQLSQPDASVPTESIPEAESNSTDTFKDNSDTVPVESAAEPTSEPTPLPQVTAEQNVPSEAPSAVAAVTSEVPLAAPDAASAMPSAVPDSTPEAPSAAPVQETASVPQQAESPDAAPAPESAPGQQPITESAAVPEPESTPMPAPEPAPTPESVSEPEPAPESVSDIEPVPEPPAEPEPDFEAVNVMERIVKDKIIYFMRQFDVCTCDRCKADVTALTLNGLMPKYIVTMKAAVDPLLSYYTNRLISDVTVEATKSCMIVKENPRH